MSICCAFSFSLLSFQGWGWDTMCVCLAPLEDLTRALQFSFSDFLRLLCPFWFGWCCLLAMASLPWIPSSCSGSGRSGSKCHGLVRTAPGARDSGSQMVRCPARSPPWSQASPTLRCPGHARSWRLPGLPSHPEKAFHNFFPCFCFSLSAALSLLVRFQLQLVCHPSLC